MVLLYAWIACLLANLVVAYDCHGSMKKMLPTKTLAARDVPLSTLSPTSIFIPSLPGDKDATAPTSIIYMGQGFISYTSVYALVMGEKGKGEEPKTNYMFQGPTEINVNKVMRTDAVGDVSTRSLFRMMCVRSGSGKPPGGVPKKPWKNSTTDTGKSRVDACSSTSRADSLLATMNCAKSPTTLDEGVTLTMSPHNMLASM